MRERPILFSAPMVRAIIDGRKTQTRRVVRPQPYDVASLYQRCVSHDGKRRGFVWTDGRGGSVAWCPYGQPGDRLWVKETWGCPPADHPRCKDGRKPQPGDRIVYRANEADDYQWSGPRAGSFCWRSPLHMPRWASRLTLEVEAVRVERVQEITHGDALAEGCEGCGWSASSPYIDGPHTDDGELPAEEFARLWDTPNAKRGHPWASNPWVWVVTFRRVEA